MMFSDSTNSNRRRDDTDIHSRPSTFVHHAPGGSSTMGSLIFGGSENMNTNNRKPQQTQQQVQKPQYSANQRSSNNRRDDTDIHSRPSTRVHAAPGGQSSMGSLIFGNSYGQTKPQQRQAPAPQPQEEVFRPRTAGVSNRDRRSDADIHSKRSTRVHHGPGGRSNMANIINGSAPQESKRSGVRRYQGPGSSNRRDDTDIHSRPSTFVHHAPGGRSNMGSIIFGNGN
jgi:hypothetical protein